MNVNAGPPKAKWEARSCHSCEYVTWCNPSAPNPVPGNTVDPNLIGGASRHIVNYQGIAYLRYQFALPF